MIGVVGQVVVEVGGVQVVVVEVFVIEVIVDVLVLGVVVEVVIGVGVDVLAGSKGKRSCNGTISENSSVGETSPENGIALEDAMARPESSTRLPRGNTLEDS